MEYYSLKTITISLESFCGHCHFCLRSCRLNVFEDRALGSESSTIASSWRFCVFCQRMHEKSFVKLEDPKKNVLKCLETWTHKTSLLIPNVWDKYLKFFPIYIWYFCWVFFLIFLVPKMVLFLTHFKPRPRPPPPWHRRRPSFPPRSPWRGGCTRDGSPT